MAPLLVLLFTTVCWSAEIAGAHDVTGLEDLTEFVKGANDGLPRLVIFSASWCGPCRIYERELGTLPEGTRRRVGVINADYNPELATALEVKSFPTSIIFNQGFNPVVFTGPRPAKVMVDVLGEQAPKARDEPVKTQPQGGAVPSATPTPTPTAGSLDDKAGDPARVPNAAPLLPKVPVGP